MAPTGSCVMRLGNLYVAVRAESRPGVYVYSPKGEELARIPTPELPTNVGFGRGSESKTLYVTYGNSATGGSGVLARIRVEQEGYQLPHR